ncbi:hypothetical protein ACUIAJ_05495 [Dermabacteraceae bacterium CCM 9519]
MGCNNKPNIPATEYTCKYIETEMNLEYTRGSEFSRKALKIQQFTFAIFGATVTFSTPTHNQYIAKVKEISLECIKIVDFAQVAAPMLSAIAALVFLIQTYRQTTKTSGDAPDKFPKKEVFEKAATPEEWSKLECKLWTLNLDRLNTLREVNKKKYRLLKKALESQALCFVFCALYMLLSLH